MGATRRTTLMGLAALLPAGLAGPAMAKSKGVEVKKIFPFLDLYLGIPANQRTLFTLAYFLKQNGGPPKDISLVLVSGGVRTPIAVGGDGRLQRLPTLADLKSKAQVEITAPEGAKIQLSMELLAKVAPAKDIPAAQLAAAIQQCEAAIKSKAGLIGFAAPKIKRVGFVGAGSGTAVNAQGVAKPLPPGKLGPQFDPEQMPGTATIKLARAPTMIALLERPKK
jgi:hypothetical protein